MFDGAGEIVRIGSLHSGQDTNHEAREPDDGLLGRLTGQGLRAYIIPDRPQPKSIYELFGRHESDQDSARPVAKSIYN